MVPKSTEEVKQVFDGEFSVIRKLFCVIELSVREAKDSKEGCIWHPGVYVWHHPDKGVLKVGRHFTNARKRALEHIRDNTGGVMGKYGNDQKTQLILFNVKDPANYHWVAAVEVFLEKELNPYVPSKRQG